MTNHIILEAKHPSPLSANKGGFFGCKHFSKVNEILKKKGYNEIDWSLN
jgi:uracil-DNA glycosylase